MRSPLLAALAILAVFAIFPILAQPAAADVGRWTPIGPDGEILSCVADPDAPGTLYAGTQGGGVWTSLDGGASWAPTPEGLGSAPVSSLAASAGRIYAGNYYSVNVLAGGDAWRQVGPFPYGVQELAVDPVHPEWIWLTGDYGNDGLLLSQDGGEHWSSKLRLAEPFRSLAIAPTVPPTVYVASNEGIFVSTNVGATWRQLSPGFPALWNEIELTVDATDAGTVYASTMYSGFWKTTDAGAHWRRAGDVAPRSLLALPGALLGFGGEGLMRSEDGGGSWETIPLPWWKIFCLTADPAAPAGAWLGIRGRGFLHTSDGGRTWVRSGGRSPRTTHVQAFAFDPFRPRTLYTSTLEPVPGSPPRARLQRSTDAGASWSKPRTLLDVRSLTADPRRPGTLYAGTPRGVSVSRDRGAHWQRVLSSSGGIATVVADPNRPGTLWAGGYRLWRSQDAGRTWARLPDPLDRQSFSAARRIFLSPWNPEGQPETVYLIDFYLDGIDVPGALWRSTDGGSTWEAIDQNDPVALAFDPTTPGLLYMADVFGYILKSRDGGTTWELVASSVGGGYHLTSLLLDPLDPSVLYAGTAGSGVWRSRDQGVTWEPLDAGMIAPTITCLEADPRDPHRLVACTQGGGLLELRTSSEP